MAGQGRQAGGSEKSLVWLDTDGMGYLTGILLLMADLLLFSKESGWFYERTPFSGEWSAERGVGTGTDTGTVRFLLNE